jgi:Na+(H+)/acetate symporter ActP
MEEGKISRIGEIQGILGKSPELGEKFNGFPRNRVVVGSENWGKQAPEGGGGGVQRSMAVVLAVPAKKENGNLGVCLIMATDMAQILSMAKFGSIFFIFG